MSHNKGFKKASDNHEIKTNDSTNKDTEIHLEEDKIQIEIDDENEVKVTEYKSTETSIEKVNLDSNTHGNNVLLMAYSTPRPEGQMFGTGQQNIYWGGNLFSQSPVFSNQQPNQQQPQNPEQQQPPPAEEPTHREFEAALDYTYTPETRNGFIKRIMTIVFIMLLITAAFIAVVLAVPEVKYVFDNNRQIIIIPSVILILIVHYAMTCLSPCTRHLPCNIILLILSVVGMSLLCGVLTSYFETNIVFYAFITTTAVVFICIILAYTSFDFTSYLLYVIVIVATFSVLAVVIMSALIMAQVELKPTFLGFLILSTLLQVIIFTIHLQTIIGGKTIELREEDYALGAYMLYMSIIDIFMKMVFMFGISSEM